MGLTGVISGVVSRPRKIVLYGTDGIGKTTWAAGAPNPIFLPTEDGCNDVGVARFPLIKSFGEFNSRISEVLTQEHEYRTLVIDTADWLERLIWEAVAQEHGKNDIEEIGYAKGPKHAVGKWAFVLKSLDHIVHTRKMAVILLAHAKVEKMDPPDNDPYNVYNLDLHASLAPMIREWADEVLFANFKTFVVKKDTDKGFGQKRSLGVGGIDRVVHTCGTASHYGKRRIPMPDEIEMEFSEYMKHVVAAKPKRGDIDCNIDGVVMNGSSKQEATANG